MGHKHLLVTQLYRLLRGALKQEHAKRLPQGFVQVGLSENDWSAGTRSLRFRQFRLFQKGRFGALSARPGGQFSARESLPIMADNALYKADYRDRRPFWRHFPSG